MVELHCLPLNVISAKYSIAGKGKSGNTKGGSITVWLTSSLTGLESAV
jgi:hypothetical protein